MSNTSVAVQNIKNLVAQGVDRAVHSPNTALTQGDAAPVANAIANQVVPAVLHATNNEPWYQSRVTWGAIGAIALPLLGLVGVTADIVSFDEFVAGGLALGTMFSGALTLYGRWKARKPIGSSDR